MAQYLTEYYSQVGDRLSEYAEITIVSRPNVNTGVRSAHNKIILSGICTF